MSSFDLCFFAFNCLVWWAGISSGGEFPCLLGMNTKVLFFFNVFVCHQCACACEYVCFWLRKDLSVKVEFCLATIFLRRRKAF